MRRWATLDANGRVTAAALALTTLTLSLLLIAFQKAGGNAHNVNDTSQLRGYKIVLWVEWVHSLSIERKIIPESGE